MPCGRRPPTIVVLRSPTSQETPVTSASLRPAPPGSGLGLSVNREDDLVVVSLSGSFDIYSLTGLRGELDALAGPTPLVVDLTEVTLIDSSGLSALLSLANRCARTGAVPFGLVCPRRRLRRVFDITGLRDAFVIGADLDAVRATWETGGDH
jgi:anti-anti-sigma factor